MNSLPFIQTLITIILSYFLLCSPSLSAQYYGPDLCEFEDNKICGDWKISGSWAAGEAQKSLLAPEDGVLSTSLSSSYSTDCNDCLELISLSWNNPDETYAGIISWDQKLDTEKFSDGIWIEIGVYSGSTSFDDENLFDNPYFNYTSTADLSYLKNGKLGISGSHTDWEHFELDFRQFDFYSSPNMSLLKFKLCFYSDSIDTDHEGVIIDNLQVDYFEYPICIGIDDHNDSNSAVFETTIFPNPCSDQISIELGVVESEELAIHLISQDGRLISPLLIEPLAIGKQQITQNLADYNLNPGAYLIQFVTKESSWTERIQIIE